MSKSNLYCFTRPLVSSHTVDMPDTNSPDSIYFLINESYDNVNHMHLVHFHHLYMNEIRIFPFLPGSIEFGKYSTAIPSIDNCLFPP